MANGKAYGILLGITRDDISTPSFSPSASLSESPSISPSISPSNSGGSASLSASPSISPSSGYKDYTRGDYTVLPTNDADLETAYSVQDVLDVETSNNIRVSQTAIGQYSIHQYKDFVGDVANCTLTWEGQSDFAPSVSTIYLQIYNYNSTSWETVNSDNTSPVNTDFTLTASILDLTNYRSPSHFITCRIYQQSL